MVDNLQNRSLATMIYVSSSSYASTPFRQMNTAASIGKSMVTKLSNVDGDTQDMLHHI
ncbi:hypothetical protein MUCCIDRAFT_157524 [Mucor lusitanicus CBS 277.49]|uniref:Uncharacterized protein n=1 Tax=Mucor lusitanicus CBS 277.49 TaxID=747725 RepID=A0A162Y9P6_MUCCL|nr:hypothetical protein MUCCIDRAFT_157524 [Mucor lusitanicus CBS 277.49]